MIEATEIKKVKFNISEQGDKGVDQTVQQMKRLALMDIDNEEIVRLIQQNKGKNKFETVKNLFDWIVTNIKYENDPTAFELVRRPLVTLLHKKGDCDCMSTLLACCLKTLDIECYYKVIAWRRHEFTHVYVTAEVLSGVYKWIPLDPVIGTIGQQKNNVLRYKIYKV